MGVGLFPLRSLSKTLWFCLSVRLLVKSAVSICSIMTMRALLTPEQIVSNFSCFLELLIVFFWLFSFLCSCD